MCQGWFPKTTNIHHARHNLSPKCRLQPIPIESVICDILSTLREEYRTERKRPYCIIETEVFLCGLRNNGTKRILPTDDKRVVDNNIFSSNKAKTAEESRESSSDNYKREITPVGNMDLIIVVDYSKFVCCWD